MIDRSAAKRALTHEVRRERRAVLVVNTRSRRGGRSFREAGRLLTEMGLRLDGAYPVRDAERLPEIVREELAKGHKYIIVGGGDGTISSVVDHFAYGNVVLGLLPLGTANSFARTLGIPLDMARAVDVLVKGRVVDLDLGRINGDYFANGASMGMPALVGLSTPLRLKKWLGRGAYALIATRKFTGYAPFHCIVTVKDRKISFLALDVRIANGAYQGGVLVAREANPDDGQIVLHILRGESKWALAREWARVALGAPFAPGEIEVIRAPELSIDAEPRQHVAIDGEVQAQTPVRVSVAREALLLMAPQASQQFEGVAVADG